MNLPVMTANAPVVIAPTVAPTKRSVHGAGAERDQPPVRVFERPILARTEPPAVRSGFAAQQPQLAARPGAARRELKPAVVAPAPVVRVVPSTREATRTLRPPTANEKGSAQPKVGSTPLWAQPAPKAGRRAEEPLPASSQPGGKKRGSSKEELEEEARC
ncbi:hypothetical protein [Rhodoferax sp.]|uniref:hypothetical protein n=1 Tax=Rhodoferax sp. TaxID=50421 RepID=UPI00271B7913|nr:hypothetical protein [Rhodoferax sp.]MDO8318702.1 hypothetical protein [Rhodoferax sp.]